MKKLVCFGMSLALLVSFAACSGGEAEVTTTVPAVTKPVEQEQRSNVVQTDPETGETYYLLADFENYWEATQVKYAAEMGKIDLIDKAVRPDMVTNGNGSIHMTVKGNSDFQRKHQPSIRINTVNSFFNLTTDFSDMTRLTFDIYNCQDYEAQVRVWIDPNIDPRFTYPDRVYINVNNPNHIIHVVELQPGWNHVEVPAEALRAITWEGATQIVLNGADALAGVGAFQLTFDRGEVHDILEEFYLDNVRAYIAEQ